MGIHASRIDGVVFSLRPLVVSPPTINEIRNGHSLMICLFNLSKYQYMFVHFVFKTIDVE